MIALFGLFCSVFGSGGAINIVFILVESRVPTERLGSTIVIVVTTAVFYSSLSPFVAYVSQPIPYLLGCTIIVIAVVATVVLEQGKNLSLNAL